MKPLHGVAAVMLATLLTACVSDDVFYYHPPGTVEDVVAEPEPAPSLTLPLTIDTRGRVTQSGWTVVAAAPFSFGRFDAGSLTSVRHDFYFSSWGVWLIHDRTRIFTAYIFSSFSSAHGAHHHFRQVGGNEAGTNPTTGSAVWSGIVRAYDASPGEYGRPVEGEAGLVVDLSAATVDVRFTDFTEEHADMAWSDLPLAKGTFAHWDGYDTIEGAFYGDGHEGVAGKFTRDALDGVFGALRE